MTIDIDKIKYCIEPSKEGTTTLYVINDQGEKIYLHSRYNPLKEAESLKEKFQPEKFDCLIILGSGLGYHLLPLKDILIKYSKIIIIDAIKKINTEIAKNQATGFLVKSGKIFFLAGSNLEEIENALNSEINFSKIKGLDVIFHPPSLRAFSEYYNKTQKIIERIINKKAGDIATKKAFGILYLKNIFKNFDIMPLLHPVSAFFNSMNNYPSIIIASGPSIEYYMDDIRSDQNRFFIITVESALNTLLQHDIIPDFFLSIDPQPVSYEHIFALNTGEIIPVFAPSTNPLIMHHFDNSKSLMSLNSHPIAQIIEDMFPDIIGSVDSKTGTVAGDAIMTAGKFGFRTIGLLGFDFSFPDFIIYPAASAYQKRFVNAAWKLNPVETINFNYIMKSSKGIKYENRFTRKSFIQYKDSIEGLIKKLNAGNLFNINHSGIPIADIKNIDFSDFKNKFCDFKILKKDLINNILSSSKNTIEAISYKKLISYIKKENIFKEIIDASIEITETKREKTITKINRLKSLLN